MLVAYMPMKLLCKPQNFLKNIFCEFYCFKQSKNLIKSCKVRVLSAVNAWEKPPYIFPIYKYTKENKFEMNDY